MYIETVSNKKFIAIENQAIRIKSIDTFRLFPKRKIIKITLRNNRTINLKFHSRRKYENCLDKLFTAIKVIYDSSLSQFKRFTWTY